MDSELRNKINMLAEEVLRVYSISTPINNMEHVVAKLGGELREESGIGLYSDGRITKAGNGFIVSIPRNQSANRKNFTVAHELGHLFLHMGYKINDELWKKADQRVFNRGGYSEAEVQANEFAAAFLMPRMEYKKIMEQNSDGQTVYIGKVAEHFNVSIDAASYRGKWLGYLQW